MNELLLFLHNVSCLVGVGFKAQPLKSAEFVDEKTFDAVTRHLPAPAKTFYDTVRLLKQPVAATLRKL